MGVRKTQPPDGSLLHSFTALPGAHVDCYHADVDRRLDLTAYITTFFDTSVFRLERRILALAGQQYATTEDVNMLANDQCEHFATWQVEQRTDDELLMGVRGQPIKTWLFTRENETGGAALYFGSAVIPEDTGTGGTPRISAIIRALTPLHKLYSRILLMLAARALRRPERSVG